MDLASVVAALASVGVRVSGSTPNNNIQGDPSRACPIGLAGPEPSGTHNDPGQHFQVYGRLSRHATLARPGASGLRGYDHRWCRSWVGLARPRGSPWSLLPSYHVPCPHKLPLAGRSRGWEWRNSVVLALLEPSLAPDVPSLSLGFH